MKYKYNSIRRKALVFKRFGGKGWSLFSCLGREVIISTLSVATLTYAKADGVSIQQSTADTLSTKTYKALTLDEVNCTGSRAPLTPSQTARMVTVLDRSDIQAAPVQSVNDLLKYVAGIDVRQRGPLGAQTDVSIRGGNYEQVAILLNGICINDPQTGHNVFDLPVELSEIERIEVLEGPAARVYGGSSLLGAINIVTYAHRQSSATLRMEGGSFGYMAAGARANIASKHWNNQLSGSYTHSDGYSRNKAGRLNADYLGIKAFYQGNYEDDEWRVRWHAGLSSKDYGSNTFYGAKWDDQFEHTLKTFTALQAENKLGLLHLKPSIYWNHQEDRFELFRDNEAACPFNYHRTEVMGVNVNAYVDWAGGRTALGADLRNEDLLSGNLGEKLDEPHHIKGTDRDYIYGLNRTNISIVLEHHLLFKRLTFTAGLTAVKNSWNNEHVKLYPGMDLGYQLTKGLRAFASWNTSLRMPSVTELYYSVGGHKADKHLKPEEVSAVEGGLRYASHGLAASIGVYYNHTRNMIDWIRHTDQGADAPWESVNFTKIDALGMECSAKGDMKQLLPHQRVLEEISLNYNYIHQDKKEYENIESKYTLEYLRHQLVGTLRLNPWRQLHVGLHYRFQERTGTFTDINGNTRDYQPYAIWDGKIDWTDCHYSVYAEVNNIFGKRYYDYGNVEQPGTWVMAGIKWQIF